MAYPVLILTAWIQQCLVDNVDNRSSFTNGMLVKNILAHTGPDSGDFTPVVRIQGIHRIFGDGELIITIHDSLHKILGVFTQEAIQKFESKYRQRITYETLHTLMIVRRANLKLLSRKDMSRFSRLLPSMTKKVSIAYLEINEVDFFSRTKHPVSLRSENELEDIYVTEDYIRLLGNRSSANLFKTNDGLLSDCEELGDLNESWYD